MESNNLITRSDNLVSLNDNAVFPGLSFFNNSKNKTDDGKFVIMKPIETGKNFANLSPFWIKKGVDGITADTVKIIKQKEGSLLIRTNSSKGTANLLKSTTFGGIMNIKVEEHHSLNDRQGIIYCPDLNNEDLNEILKELENQNIKLVHAMTKSVDNKIVRMGLYVITFNAQVLPEFINVGYLKVKVRPFIPNPMKCKKCLAYGHTQKWCNESEEFCYKCSKTLPHESCTDKICKNCQGEHFSNFKKCPIYVKEAKIMEIKTLQNVSMNEAKRRYNNMCERINKESYAEVSGNLNDKVMQEIENMKKEIQILKNKEILSSEKLHIEITKNDNLMIVNSNLIKKLKEMEKNNLELKNENRKIENELKRKKEDESLFTNSDEEEIDLSLSDIAGKIKRKEKMDTNEKDEMILKAGNSKRIVEDRNSSEDNDMFQPSRKKVHKNKPKK